MVTVGWGYWEARHAGHRGNGAGSEGPVLGHKQRLVNHLVARTGAESLLDLGCGDGAVAEGLRVRRYHGMDVSRVALRKAAWRLAERMGVTLSADPMRATYDVAISMDVIYHLNDADYRDHLETLFGSATKAVGIYAPTRRVWRWLVSRHAQNRAFVADVMRMFPGWVEWYRVGPYPGERASWVVWIPKT